MNPWLSSALADSRVRELRQEAACWRTPDIQSEAATCRFGPSGPGARPARGARPNSRVRSRVGFALVEAGLRLLATAPRS
jgi:hypothetical protein